MLESNELSGYSSSSTQRRYAFSLAMGLCIAALIGCIAPRSLSFLPGLIGLVFYAAHWKIYAQRPALPPILFIVAAMVIFLGLLSSLWALEAQEAFERSYKNALVILPACLLIGVVLSAPRDFSGYFMRYAPYALIIMLFWSVSEIYTDGFFYKLIRSDEALESYNSAAFNRGVVFTIFFLFPALAAYLCVNKSRPDISISKKYAIPALGIALLTAVFLKTDSQSAHLAFVIGIIFFAAYSFIKGWVWKPLTVIIIALMVAAPWIAIYMFNALPDILGKYSWFQSAYAMHRMEIWDFISRYALQKPLHGYGIEATKAIQDFDTKMLYFRYPVVLHPHNFALQLWIEFGAIGIAAGAAFFGFLIHKISKFPSDAARLSISVLMAIMLVAATGYGLWQGWFIGLIMLMMAYCSVFLVRERADSRGI